MGLRNGAMSHRRRRVPVLLGVTTAAAIAVGTVLATGGPPAAGPAAEDPMQYLRTTAEAAPATPAWLTRALGDGLRKRAVPADLTPSVERARYSLPRTYTPPRCHLDVAPTRQGTCRYGDPAGKTTVVLFGDSHAAQWFPAVERAARTRHWRLVNLTKSGCPAANVTVSMRSPRRTYHECDRWRRYAFDRIEALRPQLVVMASARMYDPSHSAAFDRKWYAGTATSVERLRRSGAAVLVVTDTPHMQSDPSKCLARHPGDARRCVRDRAETVTSPQQVSGERDAATRAGATVLDPTDWLCTSRCPVVVGRTQVYRDAHHVTAVYSHWLGRALTPVLAGLLR
jgi:hypothetical protein